MMLSKKNSETLENFSEKLEVEGRSLWQDARRRFMHNRAAVASSYCPVSDSPVRDSGAYAVAIYLISIPTWGMMSSAPDMGVRSLFRH